MSSQIIPLKSRVDWGDPAEFLPWRPLAFELQCRRYAARSWVLPGSSASVLHGRWPSCGVAEKARAPPAAPRHFALRSSLFSSDRGRARVARRSACGCPPPDPLQSGGTLWVCPLTVPGGPPTDWQNTEVRFKMLIKRRVGLTLGLGRSLMHGVAPQMCGRVASPLLGLGAGGRSPGYRLPPRLAAPA